MKIAGHESEHTTGPKGGVFHTSASGKKIYDKKK
jgi:hypothetical protein